MENKLVLMLCIHQVSQSYPQGLQECSHYYLAEELFYCGAFFLSFSSELFIKEATDVCLLA